MTSQPVPAAGSESEDGTVRHAEPSALEIERHTIAQIPADQRHGRPRDLFTIWFTSNLMPLTIVTGALATAVFKLPFWPAVAAIVLGNLFGALFMALHSAQGPRLEGPVARALSGTDLSWLVGLAVTIPLYYVVAMRRVRSELRAAVTVTAS